VPWKEQGIQLQDFAWVDLDASFQWRSFRRALEILAERGNRVFVVVGPFNEHLLTESGLRGYARIRDGIAAWLREHGIEHDVPPALPSELYADASHPLGEGYRRLAERIFARLPRT
jgi:lysophospholipase L1-like esterase